MPETLRAKGDETMATDDDYTEERLAEYDAAAIAQDDVIVMGFVTVVRNLRARVAELEEENALLKSHEKFMREHT